jgi:hypothetical protein
MHVEAQSGRERRFTMTLLFADVLQEVYAKGKTGALFAVVDQNTDHMIRVYFADGEILHLSCGPLKGMECLEQFAQYDFGRAIFLHGMKPPRVCDNDLPLTSRIISMVKSTGKTLRGVEFTERGKYVRDET